MTLKDFLQVFDFDNPDNDYPQRLEILILDFNSVSHVDEERFAGWYHSKNEIENDFCTALYNVIEIRPAGYSTVQIVIAC